MRIEDVIMIIVSLAALILIAYIVLTLPRQSSPAYVTYKDFYDLALRMVTIDLTIVGLVVGSTISLWYRIGRLEGRYGSRGINMPEEFHH